MPRFYRRLRRPVDERGLSIIEVLAAFALMVIMAMGLTSSMRANLNLVGKANGRQVGTQMATAAIEMARNTDFDDLSIYSGDVFDTSDPNSPDSLVTGTFPNLSFEGEPIVFAGNGEDHEVTSQVGEAPYRIYRYVTWVTASGSPQAYKRVTVVAQWPGRESDGSLLSLRQSTLVSRVGSHGFVGYVTTTSAGATTSSTPSTTPSSSTSTTSVATTSTTVASCGNSDTTGPTGTATHPLGTYSNSSTINLQLSATDTCMPITMQLSNDDGTTWSTAEELSSPKPWTLTTGQGARTVNVRYQDSKGNVATPLAVTVVVDTVAPTAPTLQSLTLTNDHKYVQLTWSVTSDTYLRGYRIYRMKSGGAYAAVTGIGTPNCNASTCTIKDNSTDRYATYTYYVQAYDEATNTSPASNTLNATTD